MRGTSRRYNIRAIDRALRLLSLLSDGRNWSLPELSDVLGFSNSTTYRLLSTLESHKYVVHDKHVGGYYLGLACLGLAHAYYHRSDLRLNALTELEKLRDETAETVHLGIPDGMEVVYLEKLHGLHAIGLMSSHVGGRAPAHCTGLGKVLLAHQDQDSVRDYFRCDGLKAYTEKTIRTIDELMEHLEKVRRQGFAIDCGEHESEVNCVAAPVFDINGEVIAAISVSGPASRIEPRVANKELIIRTIEAASLISRRLGHNPNHLRGKHG